MKVYWQSLTILIFGAQNISANQSEGSHISTGVCQEIRDLFLYDLSKFDKGTRKAKIKSPTIADIQSGDESNENVDNHS